MRVLVAVPGADLYGSDRVARETVAALAAAGHEVVVATPTDGPAVPGLRASGVEVVLVPTPVLRKQSVTPAGLLRLVADTARALPPALRLLRRVRPDLVVVNTVTMPLWSVLARARRGCRLVVHVHEAESMLPRTVQRGLLAPALLAHRVVANSRFTASVLSGVWPRLGARTTVVRNAVPGPPEPAGPARLHTPARLAYVGRISARKGVDVAVAALAALRAEGRPVRLDVVGSVFPGQEPFLAAVREQVAAAGLTDDVTFPGFAADVWPVLAAADVVLAPSVLDESFGNSAVEALLAARPLVATRQGGLLEATDGYAAVVMVPPADAPALARGIAAVLDDHATMAAAAVLDAERATARHAPAAYRTAILAALGADPAGGGRPAGRA